MSSRAAPKHIMQHFFRHIVIRTSKFLVEADCCKIFMNYQPHVVIRREFLIMLMKGRGQFANNGMGAIKWPQIYFARARIFRSTAQL